jgi:hypothetical protein
MNKLSYICTIYLYYESGRFYNATSHNQCPIRVCLSCDIKNPVVLLRTAVWGRPAADLRFDL